MDDGVDLFSRDTWLDVLSDHEQCVGGELARQTHLLELFVG
jgi:hypothetical protein